MIISIHSLFKSIKLKKIDILQIIGKKSIKKKSIRMLPVKLMFFKSKQ